MNNPYRNPRVSSNAADLYDDDPPLRRSQESIKLATPVYFGLEGSSLAPSLESFTYVGPSDISTDAFSALEGNTSPSSTNEANHTGSTTLPNVPKRGLSQRARSGSASLANAVRNLGRTRSPPHQGPQSHTSSPVSPGLSQTSGSPFKEIPILNWDKSGGSASTEDSLLSLPPAQHQSGLLLHPAALPAGAAPLLGRPPILTSSPPISAISTTGSPAMNDAIPPLVVEQRYHKSVDPNTNTDTYLQAVYASPDASL